jgi:hypothetical protein
LQFRHHLHSSARKKKKAAVRSNAQCYAVSCGISARGRIG